MFRESLRWSTALFGLLGLVNLCRGFAGGTDANIWWIDLRWMPTPIAASLMAICCLCLLAGAVLSHRPTARLAATVSCTALAFIASANAFVFWLLLARGQISTDLPLPLSAVLTLALVGGAWAHARPPAVATRRRALAAIPALALAAAFPLFQVFTFGLTNYARPADAIVVFGARVYADGTPSDALSDRVREGVRLYHARIAPRIIMSGGPGDGATSEPQAMQHLAESLGVPRDAIIQDRLGTTTSGTISSCAQLGLTRVVAVSHFYHLPRIKLLAERASITTYTAPSPQGRPLRALPVFVAREVAAWWWYYATA